MVVNEETHNWSKCSVLNVTFISEAQGTFWKRRQKDHKGQRCPHVAYMGWNISHNKEILSFTEIWIILEAIISSEINKVHRES